MSAELSEDAVAWIIRFAASLGQPAPTLSEIETLLALAGSAAHASHRQAAPIACWLAAKAGLTATEGLSAAKALSD